MIWLIHALKQYHFFGVVQRIYSLFASSTKRWKVLLDYVTLTPKPLSQTHWESRIESVKVLKFHAPKITDALLRLAEVSEDPKTRSEAKCLATYEIESFEFILGMNIWYEILFVVNSVSESLQLENMHIDLAMDKLKGLFSYFKNYWENGFNSALYLSKQVAVEMEIEPTFRKKRVIHRKKQFDEIDENAEEVKSAEESFKIDYFYYIVDQAISSLQDRFELFSKYDDIFGFLFSLVRLRSFDNCSLEKKMSWSWKIS